MTTFTYVENSATAVAIYKSTRLPALASKDFSCRLRSNNHGKDMRVVLTPTDDTSDITIWTSIEGNSIIIAACLPTLQPLFDRILGRGLFGSTAERQKNEGYQGYRSNDGVKVELATIGSKGLRTPKPRRKNGVSDTTIGGGSQESILDRDTRTLVGHSNSMLEEGNGIRRTHDVTVVYEK
jgi:hypothetical protein